MPLLAAHTPPPAQTKGTTAQGTKHRKSHALCVRCGKKSFHLQRNRCASCAYPAPKMRKFAWAYKSLRRRTTGTGRMRYLKTIQRRFNNGFREGFTAKPKTVKAN